MKAWRHTALVVAVALVARLAIVAWAFDTIRPIADGTYYDILGRRISEGQGYTWLWPDGVVTYAAHYPVGYPALVALAYLVAGPTPGSAMVLNALIGAIGAGFMHRAALHVASPRAASIAAVLGFALHPALVLYTPALMTEGVTATFLAVALSAALAARTLDRRRRFAALIGLGVTVGAATLVRPQLLVFAPLFGLVAAALPLRVDGRPPARVSARVAKLAVTAAVALACALVVVAPWTARNCSKMGRCALVSLNGGWNLLIGTNPKAQGTWAPVEVPPACLEVFDEAEKDRCLGREGARAILHEPGMWLSLAPKKLSATFDHVGAGPWYLHDANPSAFSERARWFGGLLEEIAQRVLFALAMAAVAGPLVRRSSTRVRRSALIGAALVGLAAPGFITVLAFSLLALAAVVWSGSQGDRRDAVQAGGEASADLPDDRARAAGLALAGIATLCTALTHIAFFGAGRYALVIIPALVLGAATFKAFDRQRQS
ncbi:MAG: hypothetical protein HOW73_49675 [Polyangiaceae bacterium]|nr:hypothetical protein [Polyangiaceae bacterium]